MYLNDNINQLLIEFNANSNQLEMKKKIEISVGIVEKDVVPTWEEQVIDLHYA